MRRALHCAALVALLLASTPPLHAGARPATGIQAWQRVHYADLDGDGVPDKIWFTLGSDFRTPRADFPSGHWTLHVTPSSTGLTVERAFRVNGYGADSRKRWTPWVGATDLDHAGGLDLVLGAEAANADILRVVVYTEGSLRVLPGPGAARGPSYWPVVATAFGGDGFRCTADGVVAVGYAANGPATRWRLDRDTYVWSQDAWRLRQTSTRYAHTKANQALKRKVVARYTGFDCAGLPRDLRQE